MGRAGRQEKLRPQEKCFFLDSFYGTYQITVAVGTIVADRPPHRTVRAALPHTAPTLEGLREVLLLARRSILGTLFPRTVSGECWTERCSPWPAPFSPQAPPKIALLCSSGSSILWRGPTPPERTRPPCGFRPSRTGLLPLRAEALQRSPGSRACCFSACAGSQTTQDRLLARVYREQPWCLPPIRRESASWFCVFRSSIARPTGTPVYASSDTSRCLPQD
jgi:hypothetical protein